MASLYWVDKMLIHATDVEMVEFLKMEEEVSVDTEQIEKVEDSLLKLHSKGE